MKCSVNLWDRWGYYQHHQIFSKLHNVYTWVSNNLLMANKINSGLFWCRVMIWNNEFEDDNYCNQNFSIARFCFTYDGNDLLNNLADLVSNSLHNSAMLHMKGKWLVFSRFPNIFKGCITFIAIVQF